ncbi:MAG: hypothetical protein ABIL77_01725 [candidate division WOR-3 bacterium]
MVTTTGMVLDPGGIGLVSAPGERVIFDVSGKGISPYFSHKES